MVGGAIESATVIWHNNYDECSVQISYLWFARKV